MVNSPVITYRVTQLTTIYAVLNIRRTSIMPSSEMNEPTLSWSRLNVCSERSLLLHLVPQLCIINIGICPPLSCHIKPEYYTQRTLAGMSNDIKLAEEKLTQVE